MKLLEERDRNPREGVERGINRKGLGRKIPSLVGDVKKPNLSMDNMSGLSAEIEDLDKLNTSQFIFAHYFYNKYLPSIPPVKIVTNQVSQPVGTDYGYSLRSGVMSKTSPGLNLSQNPQQKFRHVS